MNKSMSSGRFPTGEEENRMIVVGVCPTHAFFCNFSLYTVQKWYSRVRNGGMLAGDCFCVEEG
jgi:hypothetical protein